MTGSPERDQPSLLELASLVECKVDKAQSPGDEIAMIRAADELLVRSQERLSELVANARSQGVSWQSIGEALGVSRQAAFKRFSNPVHALQRGELMPQQTIDLTKRTEDVFRLLDAGDYEAVRANMTYTCARALSKRKLMGVWEQVVADTGRLQNFGDSTVQTPDGTTALTKFANRHLITGAIVQTVLNHEAGEWWGRVAYNGAGKITGILIVPPGSQNLTF